VPDLSFRIDGIEAQQHAAIPTVIANIHITNANPTRPVHSIVLNCQVQLETARRGYSAAEEAKLLDLFGERERWSKTMKPMLWTNVVVKVPSFATETVVDLPLPCTLDFDVAATKYFYGLDAGNISVSVMFSGTVFYVGDDTSLQVSQIPWDREAGFKLPVEAWRAAIDAHYANTVWMRLPTDTFDRMYRYKVERGIPSWERLMEHLLDSAEHVGGKKALNLIVGSAQ
jgi:hypothetical protein